MKEDKLGKLSMELSVEVLNLVWNYFLERNILMNKLLRHYPLNAHLFE